MTEIMLKPCPFCGGEAVMEEVEEKIFGTVRFSVGCATEDEATCMGYQSLTTFSRRKDAAEAWNTRAIPAQGDPAAIFEECAEIALEHVRTAYPTSSRMMDAYDEACRDIAQAIKTRASNRKTMDALADAKVIGPGNPVFEETRAAVSKAREKLLAELQREKAEMVKALYRIANHASTHSDFPHGVEGLQQVARAALALVKP